MNKTTFSRGYTVMRGLFAMVFLSAILLMAKGTALAQHANEWRNNGVVKIVAAVGGREKTGTGFIVPHHDADQHNNPIIYIVTASHVVEGDKYPKVSFFSRRHSPVEAEVLKTDRRSDIALLKIRDSAQVPKNTAALALSVSETIGYGDKLNVIGFPPGISWGWTPVTLASQEGLDLVFSARLDEGYSGAPVLADDKVIGMITDSGHKASAVPAEIIARALKGWGIALQNNQTTVKPPAETRLPFEPEMVRIPSGSFLMGSPETEAGRDSDEGPQHRVNVASFTISRTEITVAQFRQFVQDSRYQTTAEKNGEGCVGWNEKEKKVEQLPQRNWSNPGFKQTDDHPVVCVSWDDAQAYVAWLTDRTGVTYRLPTEAEWEYVARAGTSTARYYRDDQQCDYANGLGQEAKSIADSGWILANCSDSYVYTAPVASFGKNPFGLFDILGNVWEWTQDCWHENYDNAPTDGAAWLNTNGGDCDRRVVRGGSWIFSPRILRSADRLGSDSVSAYYILGFRIARAL